MKPLYILFFVILFCCCNNRQTLDNTRVDTVSDSSYFEIHDGASDRYNSLTGSLTRLYQNGFKTYKIVLSDNEKESIDSLFKAVDFHSFPPEFEVLLVVADVSRIISPVFTTSIEVCEGGNCKKVMLDFENLGNPINDKDKALEYEKLYLGIWKIISNKEEYKNIPKSDFEYL